MTTIAATAQSAYPIDPMPAEIAALRQGSAPVWIFAYGSLMWNPEMPYAERRPALLRGWLVLRRIRRLSLRLSLDRLWRWLWALGAIRWLRPLRLRL